MAVEQFGVQLPSRAEKSEPTMCAYSPENSALRVTPELEKAINEAPTAEAVTALMRQAYIDQKLVTVDPWNETCLYENENPRKFTKEVIVDGVRVLIDGPDEISVLAKENRMLQELAAHKTTPVATTAATTKVAETTDQLRDAAGRFAEQPKPVVVDAATKAALALQLQLGQIDVATYIEKSGAVSDYLEKQGVPLAELQTAVSDRQIQGWQSATDTFLSRHSEWQGGDENMQIIGRLIAENNLVDAEDKEDALEKAYAHALKHDLLKETPEHARQTTYESELASCTTQAQMDSVIAKWNPSSRSARSNQQLR